MGTMHERAIRELTEEALKDPVEAEGLTTTLANMYGDSYWHWPQFVVQKDRTSFDLYDAYCVAWFRRHLCMGSLVHATINVHNTPLRDADREGNQRILTDNLRNRFRATVEPGESGDGAVWWLEPIVMKATPAEGEPFDVTVNPGRVHLEIGTTAGSRTILHLAQEEGLARWPYGSEHILLVCWRPAFIRPSRALGEKVNEINHLRDL